MFVLINDNNSELKYNNKQLKKKMLIILEEKQRLSIFKIFTLYKYIVEYTWVVFNFKHGVLEYETLINNIIVESCFLYYIH